MKEQDINPTHSFKVEDAIRLGSVEKAIILKEIERMAVYKARNGKDPWVYYSSSALSDKFPYMAPRSIRRWLVELVEKGELEAKTDNKYRYDRTVSYRPAKIGKVLVKMSNAICQNDQPIPPLSSPLEVLQQASPEEPAPQKPVRKKNSFGYNESAPSDSYEDAIDLDTGQPLTEVSRSSASKSMKDLVEWAVKRRGGPFASLPKQYKAMATLKRLGVKPDDVMDRWVDMEGDRYYQDKGFDFMDVVSSFNRKPLKK